MGSLGEEQQYVYYHAGGKPGRRPILTGAAAKPTFDEIPLIDFTDAASDSLEARRAVAKKVGRACEEVGFFYAQNHGVPQDVIDGAFAAVARYLAQPREKKMENHIHKNHRFRGYEPLYETKLDPTTKGDLKEAFMMGEDPMDPEQKCPFPVASDAIPQNNWPSNAEEIGLRPALYAYWTHLQAWARRLLHIFALSLDLPENYFDSMCKFPISSMRSLRYPNQETSDGSEVGIGGHTDYAWFTTLCQKPLANGGHALEILNQNGIWVPAPPIPNTFVINIADFLMQATNYRWQSTVHRVVNKTGGERWSIAFFLSPDEDAVIKVLPTCREEGKEYEEIKVGEYLTRRLYAARYQHPDTKKFEKEEGKPAVEGAAPKPVVEQAKSVVAAA